MHVEPNPSPSWAVPIAIGSIATFLTLLLCGALQSTGTAQFAMVAACCCVGGFLPYGLLPTWVALRRDPSLTAGQGFSVAFIAVGIGTIFWAGIVAWNFEPVDPELLRQAFQDAQQSVPKDDRMTDAQIQELVDLSGRMMPFLPAVYATITSLLGGLVGLILVAISRGSNRPEPDAEDAE